jgi:hypothetical protein
MMPEEYFVTDLTRQRALKWMVFGGVVAAAVLAAAYPFNVRARQKTTILEPLRANVASMELWGERVAPVTERLRVASTHQEAANELLHQPFWNGFLSDVAAATGGELRITQLDTAKHLMGKDDLETEVYLVTISGMAPSNFEVIGFMRRLSSSEHLQSLELEVSRAQRTKDEGPGIEFIIQGIAQ